MAGVAVADAGPLTDLSEPSGTGWLLLKTRAAFLPAGPSSQVT